MVAAVVPRPPWCLTPVAAIYDNQPTFWVTVVCVLRREWGTMVAIVGHLDQDAPIDVVGCCGVYFCKVNHPRWP